MADAHFDLDRTIGFLVGVSKEKLTQCLSASAFFVDAAASSPPASSPLSTIGRT
jgi:hypothetical protein